MPAWVNNNLINSTMSKSLTSMFRCCMRPLVKDDEVPVKDRVAEAPQKQSVNGSEGADKAMKLTILV
jgi:hypothetical protein